MAQRRRTGHTAITAKKNRPAWWSLIQPLRRICCRLVVPIGLVVGIVLIVVESLFSRSHSVSLLLTTAGPLLAGNGLINDEQQQTTATTTTAPDAAVDCHHTNKGSNNYFMASTDSYGYFDDIAETDWIRLRRRVHDQQPNHAPVCADSGKNVTSTANANSNNEKCVTPSTSSMMTSRPEIWFQTNYEPEFACQHERRIGKMGDGGKWICDPHRIVQQKQQQQYETTKARSCLVYSIGSNGDFSFERAIYEEIGDHCVVHTFDPGDYRRAAIEQLGLENSSTNTSQRRRQHHYHQWAIGPQDTTQVQKKQQWIVKTLATTMKELGHTTATTGTGSGDEQQRVIDILKIDCEGCELRSYQSWLDAAATHNILIRQMLIEVHANGRAPIIPQTQSFFHAMYGAGYVIFHKEYNLEAAVRYSFVGIEYAFIKLAPSFFVNNER